MQINVGSWWKWLQTSLIWCFFPNDESDENSKTGKDEQHTKVIIWQALLPLTLIACLQRWYTTVVNRNKTEAQNSKQNHKTQNRITKPKTESQNSKQNHKTQSRITKLKTETQNSKQNHKTQNWLNPGSKKLSRSDRSIQAKQKRSNPWTKQESVQINVGSWWKWLQTSLIWCFFPNDESDENSKTGKDEQHTKVIIWQALLPLTLIACLQRWYTTVVNRNKTEAQNSKQNHKTQNRITKPKTESQNSKQNHKTQSRITKLKTETQNSKQNHKTQNWFVGYKYTTTSCKSTWDTVPYFGINGLSMILCLWSPFYPLSKSLAIQDHTQNLEEQLWMGGGRSVLYLTEQWPGAIWSKKRFFRGSVSTFLQVVETLLFFYFFPLPRHSHNRKTTKIPDYS